MAVKIVIFLSEASLLCNRLVLKPIVVYAKDKQQYKDHKKDYNYNEDCIYHVVVFYLQEIFDGR